SSSFGLWQISGSKVRSARVLAVLLGVVVVVGMVVLNRAWLWRASGDEQPPGWQRWVLRGATVVVTALALGGVWLAAGGSFAPDPFPDSWGLTRSERARLASAFAEPMRELQSSPGWTARSRSADDYQLATELAERGVMRLSERDLVRRNELSLTMMSQTSRSACAGAWRGWVPPGEALRTVLTLSDAELDEWVQIQFRAAFLELDHSEDEVPLDDARDEGIAAIAASLAPPERSAFARAIAEPQVLDDAAACRTLVTLIRGADQLEPTLRIRFLRTMAWRPPAQPHPARGLPFVSPRRQSPGAE
ncbi:MAG: hypothetical protein K8H88_29015, partial [Sandaracinaceae bacterium]|nr:hypothetical protein [Sandaracinaceae bacterium]